MMTGDGLTEDR